jgi:branched-chain amino acid transport system permease protein
MSPQIVIIYSLVNGGVYALLSVGFSLIFGVGRVLNLSHAGFLMLASYGMYFFSKQQGLGVIESIAITVAAVTLLGMLIYKLFIDRIREHPTAVLLVTIALLLIFEQVLFMSFGGNPGAGADLFVSGYSVIFGIKVINQYLVILGIVAVAITVTQLLLTKTKLGITIRAVADDAEIANLMGISASRTLLITTGIATALAAVAGVVMAPIWPLTPGMWGSPMLMMMVIVILGGLGSIKGSIIGAFIIGFIQILVVALLPGGGYLNLTFVLLAMVIVLIVRPEGLFGTVFEEEKL